jgi:DNA-binding Xre family transcriptional regulator
LCASQFCHAWIATTLHIAPTLHYVHVHRTYVEDAWIAGQERAAQRLKGSFHEVEPPAGRGQPRHLEGKRPQRMLAELISAGKVSGLWSGNPASIKLDDLDVICAVVGCGVEELLIAEPAKVASAEQQSGQVAAMSGAPTGPLVTPKRRDGRSLPPT